MKKLYILFIISFNLINSQTKLTLNQAIAIGLKNNKAILNSELKQEIAALKYSEANSQFLPTLKVAASYNRLSEVDAFTIPFGQNPITFPVILNNYSSRLYFQQPIFTGFRISSIAESAEHNLLASTSEYKKDLGDLVVNITSIYWNYYSANEFVKISKANLFLISSILEDTENLIKQGLATKSDLLKIKMQFSNAQLQVEESQNNLQLAKINLNNLIGSQLDENIELIDSPNEDLSQKFNLENLISEGLLKRSDLKAIEEKKLSSQAQINSAQSQWYPNIYLQGGYNYSRPNQRIFPAKDEANGTWDVGLTLQYDIWNNQTSNYQISSAEIQTTQLANSMELMRNSIKLEITSNYLTLEQIKMKYENSILNVEFADEVLRTAKEKQKSGLMSKSEMLSAEFSLHQAKLKKLQTIIEYQIASVKLQNSTGSISIVNE